MLTLIICYIMLITNCACFLVPAESVDPEVKMNVPEIIKYYGYPCEIHEVTTADGYILTLHRIPHGVQATISEKRVVLLQHGLGDSSFNWVASGPKKSLGFVLADNGFDVWLGNTRGNTYSNKHEKYASGSREFWDFSWDDMAEYDLPALINYVLSVTRSEKLGYIGHSQGTEIAFARFSKDSEFDSKVSAFVALTPVAYLGHLKTVIKYIAGLAGGINLLSNIFGNGEFMPRNELMSEMTTFVCGEKTGSLVCGNLMFLMVGKSVSNLNYTRLPIYLSHVPAGTSTKNMAHYAQSHLSNEFQKYDYGFLGNMFRYKQFTPPKYQLNQVKIPTAAFWGGNDLLAVPEDVSRTLNELGDCVKFKKYIPDYNHVDFTWGITADTEVFPDIINFLNQYKG